MIVQLRDIVTDADRADVMTLRRGPGQDRYLGSMASHFEDAVADARACPRMWSVRDGDLLVGFVMISDGIPPERLAADDDLVGPYYLWRLLVDERFQGRGYGSAARSTPWSPISAPGPAPTCSGPAARPAPARPNRSTCATGSS